MTIVVVQPPYTTATCEIVRDEDWYDPLPQFLDGDMPADLTGVTIEIFIRPVRDHSILIKKLSTDDGSIVIDDASNGLASVNVGKTEVMADLPVGAWEYFCRQSVPETDDPDDGIRYQERFRGPFIVHAGRDTP